MEKEKKNKLGMIIGIVCVLIAAFVVVAAIQPDDYRYERSATINAPAPLVFEHVNDLQKWQAWSPWARMEPEAKTSFQGPIAGPGAILKWDGNKTGQGTMTILESRAPEFVKYQLDFVKPFAGTSHSEITLRPEGNQTSITWSMYGKNDFMGKVMSLVMNCEKMIGTEFEKGFANLKEIVEQ